VYFIGGRGSGSGAKSLSALDRKIVSEYRGKGRDLQVIGVETRQTNRTTASGKVISNNIVRLAKQGDNGTVIVEGYKNGSLMTEQVMSKEEYRKRRDEA
jgi:hypothetical protein